MSKFIAVMCLLLTSVGCVSTHPGTKAKSNLENDSLIVSSHNNTTLTDKYYMFLEFTFENKSSEWKDISVKRLGFDKTKTTEILVNDRLKAWIEGAELKLKKNDFNTSVVLGSIAAVGGVTGALSNNGNLQIAGLATFAGASAVATARQFGRDRLEAQSGVRRQADGQTVYVPSTYILTPFKVAPGSYVKRWVVVRKPKKVLISKKGSTQLKSISRRNKNLWAEENGELEQFDFPNMISEIDQNGKTVIYTTSF